MIKYKLVFFLKFYIIIGVALFGYQQIEAQETSNTGDTIYIPKNTKIPENEREIGINYINVDIDASSEQESISAYIKRNQKYPDDFEKEILQGNSVGILFTIDEDGEIKDVCVKYSVSPLLDAEVIRLISSLPQQLPAQKNNKNVAVQIFYPITFPDIKRPDDVLSTTGYWVAEYPGGERTLLSYIASNLRYPVNAAEARIEGKVVIRFIISREGKVLNPEIIKTADRLLNAEAKRVVLKMPDWMPAVNKGEYISTYFTLPVVFRLE